MGGPHPGLPPAIEGQTYCLRWNNHKSNLVEILDALIKVESYVDCTIVVDDQIQFKAHRVVLAANSPYFQAILQDVPMDHCSIIFPGVKAFEMRALLDYMYTGEVNVTQSQIPTIMRIAEELEVKGLFDMADLKEKFNKLSEEHAERHGYPYGVAGTSALTAPYAIAAGLSTAPCMPTAVHNGTKDHDPHLPIPPQHNSSSVISTSSKISPSGAATSTSSPPYSNYKSQYSNLYSKSPGPSNCGAATSNVSTGQTKSANTPQTPTHSQAQPNTDRGQWPLSPSAAVSMLGSVYDSVPDNPLKRKKLSSMTSMLMNRDTPILRTVLAQTSSADSSQPMPFSLPVASKADKSNTDKSSHTGPIGTHNSNHAQAFNGIDFGGDKKYQEEPHSPYTDRSYEDDGYDGKGNYSGGFSSNANQKPEWKRYKQYTRSDIMSAIQCVREGMSALQASRKFGVPSRTLYDKVKKLGITTGRPMNRTMKRSPSNMDSSAAFSYPHAYGAEPLLSSLHEGRNDEREPKDHHRAEHHHIPPQLPHSLLDHALLQQALESRGGDIAGRGALLLAAAAHAAANRISTSPGPNGSNAMRSPSPSNYGGRKYSRVSEQDFAMDRERERERTREHDNGERVHEHERRRMMSENDLDSEREIATEIEREHEREREIDREYERKRLREFEREHERDLERERNRSHKRVNRRHSHEDEETVEDLSVTRRRCLSPQIELQPQRSMRSPSYSPPPLPPPPQSAAATITSAIECTNNGVIKLATAAAISVTATTTANPNENSRCSSRSSIELTVADNNSIDDYNNECVTTALETTKAMTAIKHELINSDDGRAD